MPFIVSIARTEYKAEEFTGYELVISNNLFID
jgi:hypothetical protein